MFMLNKLFESESESISLNKIIQALCLCIISFKTCVIVPAAYKCVTMFTDE